MPSSCSATGMFFIPALLQEEGEHGAFSRAQQLPSLQAPHGNGKSLQCLASAVEGKELFIGGDDGTKGDGFNGKEGSARRVRTTRGYFCFASCIRCAVLGGGGAGTSMGVGTGSSGAVLGEQERPAGQQLRPGSTAGLASASASALLPAGHGKVRERCDEQSCVEVAGDSWAQWLCGIDAPQQFIRKTFLFKYCQCLWSPLLDINQVSTCCCIGGAQRIVGLGSLVDVQLPGLVQGL